jgi:Holliday junction resolvasome RuvABC endonuclease subunit
MGKSVLSLDISTTSTGWCFYKDSMYNFGTIKPTAGLDNSKKLVIFRVRLLALLNQLKPDFIVVEDTFGSRNLKVLKQLSEFAGVAKECCTSFVGQSPEVMSNTTPKSYFKCKTKEDLYKMVTELFDMADDGTWTFKTHNDITDAIAQNICYCDTILKCTEIREEKDYGYLFRV